MISRSARLLLRASLRAPLLPSRLLLSAQRPSFRSDRELRLLFRQAHNAAAVDVLRRRLVDSGQPELNVYSALVHHLATMRDASVLPALRALAIRLELLPDVIAEAATPAIATAFFRPDLRPPPASPKNDEMTKALWELYFDRMKDLGAKPPSFGAEAVSKAPSDTGSGSGRGGLTAPVDASTVTASASAAVVGAASVGSVAQAAAGLVGGVSVGTVPSGAQAGDAGGPPFEAAQTHGPSVADEVRPEAKTASSSRWDLALAALLTSAGVPPSAARPVAPAPAPLTFCVHGDPARADREPAVVAAMAPPAVSEGVVPQPNLVSTHPTEVVAEAEVADSAPATGPALHGASAVFALDWNGVREWCRLVFGDVRNMSSEGMRAETGAATDAEGAVVAPAPTESMASCRGGLGLARASQTTIAAATTLDPVLRRGALAVYAALLRRGYNERLIAATVVTHVALCHTRRPRGPITGTITSAVRAVTQPVMGLVHRTAGACRPTRVPAEGPHKRVVRLIVPSQRVTEAGEMAESAQPGSVAVGAVVPRRSTSSRRLGRVADLWRQAHQAVRLRRAGVALLAYSVVARTHFGAALVHSLLRWRI
eukprot:TRINITY_DN58299_c0_g1_i1.p1 TRINITY_DN58299_c0_g1~~TRINITY_DN58299_c0_g1_i1.p1  ORF type:complete len:598 (+),score=86.55 TRINITY_DN58299_c0_g1_i1:146-1939(+)